MARGHYGFDPADTRRGALLFAWLVVAHLVLVAFASGSCSGTVAFGSATALIDPVPGACEGTGILGDLVRLELAARDGAWLGLGAPAMTGFTGQLYGLTLLFVAAMTAVLLLRWRWTGPADTRIVAALAAAGFIDAVPRLLGGGVGLTPLDIAGFGFGIDDVALPLGLIALASRALGELRA